MRNWSNSSTRTISLESHHYSPDATALPPGSAVVRGASAIEAMWKSMAEQVGDLKLTTVEVKPLGASAAREIGTYSLKTEGSTPQKTSAKYVVVWEKVGKDWKLGTDIWNDSKWAVGASGPDITSTLGRLALRSPGRHR